MGHIRRCVFTSFRRAPGYPKQQPAALALVDYAYWAGYQVVDLRGGAAGADDDEDEPKVQKDRGIVASLTHSFAMVRDTTLRWSL
jgi:hypothetical protein